MCPRPSRWSREGPPGEANGVSPEAYLADGLLRVETHPGWGGRGAVAASVGAVGAWLTGRMSALRGLSDGYPLRDQPDSAMATAAAPTLVLVKK